MSYRNLLSTILFTLSIFTFSLSADTVRIMPLGDSITDGVTDEELTEKINIRVGYRQSLWNSLKSTGMDVDFVGSQISGSSATPPFDAHHEGHPDWTSYDIAEKTYSFVYSAKPHNVLLHIGANDNSTSIYGLNAILNEIDAYEVQTGQTVRVFLAKIINRREYDLNIAGFNKNVEELFYTRWEKGDILTLVDMEEEANLKQSDYSTRTHPNASGYEKMASVWLKAIQTPYVKYTSAPIANEDKISAETGSIISYNILANDTDRQNDISVNSVSFVGGEDTDNDNDNNVLSVDGEGKWSVDEVGIMTFTPNKSFTNDPTPVQYTVSDEENETSEPATITIDYSNSSLDAYPSSIVPTPYIESVSIDEVSNSVTFITRIPENGILF
ncbi:MAG: Unknown protein [uncultured Sulfurovum sp.]|uniref:CshA domain-containing protein n=1 Tax=uncultured Sulfurovum sp. TaxID=269237 RepID=A0A6S6TFJ6_9BACT|nr:MAG: Unknown protein [uncultured Sulfurovum sp.]